MDRKNINDFIAVIQKDRHAYEMFRKEAERSGMEWAEPISKKQSKMQFEYFKTYIEPQQRDIAERKQLQERSQMMMITGRNSVSQSHGSHGRMANNRSTLGTERTAQSFIPLADLLKRNHNDRVAYHLSMLEGEEQAIAGGPSQDDHGKSFGQASPQIGNNRKSVKPDDKQQRIIQEIN